MFARIRLPLAFLGTLLAILPLSPAAAARLTLRAVPGQGVDLFADGKLVAPIRLSTNGAITARRTVSRGGTLRLEGLRCKDAGALTLSPDSYVSISTTGAEPVVRFRLHLTHFDAKRWQALFPGGTAPFHFLSCSMPTAQVWHQRGWLNATPNADPFPLLQDVHIGEPEISCLWNRNWSYICPLGAHPIPMIGVWDPARRLYVGYDFQEARATDQSERYVSTAYCWQQDRAKSFITLAFPHGGLRYTELTYPHAGQVIESFFRLVIDTNLPGTADPNERFQARLFARYADALPRVPAMNDLSWIPGSQRLNDFVGPIGVGLWGPGGEATFYPQGTILTNGWTGHREMPIDTAVRRGDQATLALARQRIDALLAKYAKRVTVAGEECLFWEKPLEGQWRPNWGGAPVTTMHNTDAWYPARVLVELYRYDRARGQAKAEDVRGIDGIFNWTKHFVWTRNEFADVPSSPFAIGGTLSTAFLLDYYFTFREDPARRANAQLALQMARNVTWRYLSVWAMDSDRFDGALDSAFLIEPNSGRDWAGLACANEVHWNIDTLTQVYVHTGDARMRYYLRGILQRWPALYRPAYEASLADYGRGAFTEGLGLFDGAGPGRGGRYSYGGADLLPLNEPIGSSKMRVIAGARACIAFCKGGTHSDVTDYRTDGSGSCSFRVLSSLPGAFDVSFSYPYVDVSRLPVHLVRAGKTRQQQEDEVIRPEQSPSSLMLRGLRNGDVVRIGTLAAGTPIVKIEEPLTAGASAKAGAGGPPAGRNAQGFVPLALTGDVPLKQDWNDLRSFAGIVPGERWVYGVPYVQGTRGATRPVKLAAAGAHAVFVAYAPTGEAPLASAPTLVLDNGQGLKLSGKPVPAWQGWPPIFSRQVLLDSAAVPAGRRVTRVDPKGTLLMAATVFRGSPAALKPVTAAVTVAAAEYARKEKERQALLALRARFADLPSGKMAILPGAAGGATANFLAITGLRQKCVALTAQQLIDPAQFSASRFPVTFYLGGEHYPKSVRNEGDGKDAIIRYLSQGGTLTLLASDPLPLCYGDGPGSKMGAAEPLLPVLGLPVQNAFEKAPGELRMLRAPGQEILRSVPEGFPFPPGDPRLRSVNRALVNPAHHYTGLISVKDPQGKEYGDAACFIELGAGPAKGGKLLYVWSTLLAGPEGSAICGDVLGFALRKP